MTAQDAAELLERFEADPETVAWEIVARFTPYIQKQSSKYFYDFDDMVAEAQIFFHGNLLRWDPERGTPFGAFVYVSAKFGVRSAALKLKRQWERKNREGAYPEFEDSGEELLGAWDDDLEGHADHQYACELTTHLLGTLRPRDREMVEMRFGLGDHQPMSVQDIADHFGVSRNLVGRNIKLALVDMDWSQRRDAV